MNNDKILSRQIAFFAAFVLPVYKLLELPALLSGFTKGDLLLPAFLQYLIQMLLLCGLLFAASRSGRPLVERLHEKLGKGAIAVYLLYAAFFLFTAALPLLDLEKFVYAAFYDTAPTLFSFAAFFLFSAFVATKGIKSLGRSADLALFLFLLPFLALLVMAVGEADLTGLLPLFEQKFSHTLTAVKYTAPHFSDTVFLLPLIFELSYKKGDGKKIVTGYAAGAAFTLVFLAVFYSLYSTIAPREHYAFLKIAQYFPALTVIGRIDLLFVYMLSIVLFWYTATPLLFTVELTARSFGTNRKTLVSAAVNLVAFLFVLFFNRRYDGIYELICNKLTPVFWVLAGLGPLASILLTVGKEKKHAKSAR